MPIEEALDPLRPIQWPQSRSHLAAAVGPRDRVVSARERLLHDILDRDAAAEHAVGDRKKRPRSRSGAALAC
jgi:hypothetical protein